MVWLEVPLFPQSVTVDFDDGGVDHGEFQPTAFATVSQSTLFHDFIN